MSGPPPGAIRRAVTDRLRGLRFPTLFSLVAILFVVDLLVPDVIPFVDEILLGLLTVLLGALRDRSRAAGRGGAERAPETPPRT